MAYKKMKASYDVTGLSVKDFINKPYEEIRGMGEKDLARYVTRAVSVANKRIARFEKAGISSPAVMKLGTDYRFSVKFGDIPSEQRRGKLLNLTKRLKNFLGARTSTIKGEREYRTEQIEKIETAIGRPVTKGETEKAFRILHKAQQSGDVDSKRGSAGSLHGREVVFDILNEDINLSDDEILERLNNEMDTWEQQETNKLNIGG